MASNVQKKNSESFANVSAGARIENAWFADDIIDENKYVRVEFLNCHFSGVGAKKATIDGGQFQNCIFEDCYFNGARFRAVRFVGCKFVRCVMNNADFDQYCGMEYTRFYDCALAYNQVSHILPGNNPSDSYRLLRNLAEENRKIGHWEQTDQLILKSISEQERYFNYIFLARNQYYRDRYQLFERIQYFVRYCWSKLLGLLWGHGFRAGILARNITIFIFFIGPIMTYNLGAAVARDAVGFVSHWGDLVYFVLQVSLPGASLFRGAGYAQQIGQLSPLVEVTFALIGFVAFGMFLAVLQRSVGRGR